MDQNFKVGTTVLVDCTKNSINVYSEELPSHRLGIVVGESLDPEYDLVVKFDEPKYFIKEPYFKIYNYDIENTDKYYAGVKYDHINKAVKNTKIARKMYQGRIIKEEGDWLYVKKNN